MQRFGLGHATGIDLAQETSGRLKLPGDSDWGPVELGTNAYRPGCLCNPHPDGRWPPQPSPMKARWSIRTCSMPRYRMANRAIPERRSSALQSPPILPILSVRCWPMHLRPNRPLRLFPVTESLERPARRKSLLPEVDMTKAISMPPLLAGVQWTIPVSSFTSGLKNHRLTGLPQW